MRMWRVSYDYLSKTYGGGIIVHPFFAPVIFLPLAKLFASVGQDSAHSVDQGLPVSRINVIVTNCEKRQF